MRRKWMIGYLLGFGLIFLIFQFILPFYIQLEEEEFDLKVNRVKSNLQFEITKINGNEVINKVANYVQIPKFRELTKFDFILQNWLEQNKDYFYNNEERDKYLLNSGDKLNLFIDIRNKMNSKSSVPIPQRKYEKLTHFQRINKKQLQIDFTKLDENLILENEKEKLFFKEREKILRLSLEEKKYLKEPFLFIHIAKTGGTSLSNTIKMTWDFFYHHWHTPPIQQIEKVFQMKVPPVLGGHLCFGFHRWWENPFINLGSFVDRSHMNDNLVTLYFDNSSDNNNNNNNNNINNNNLNDNNINNFDNEEEEGEEGEGSVIMNSKYKKVFKYEKREKNLLDKYTYFTLMRDPVDRVLSHYFYHKTKEKDPNHKYAANSSISDWMVNTKYGNNVMTSYLAGYSCLSWWNDPFTPIDQNNVITKNPDYYYSNADDGRSFQEKFDERIKTYPIEVYKKARENLLQFGVVGITEEYNFSILHLSQYIDLEIHLENLNKNPNEKEKVSDEDLENIKQLNYYDIKLYQLGLLLFKQQHQILMQFVESG